MALSASSLADRIASELAAANLPVTENALEYWTAIGKAIVDEIKSGAVVTVATNVPVAVTPATGIGATTGTGTGSIT